MTNYRATGYTTRTRHWTWCDLTETVRICRRCLAIVPERVCIHCDRKTRKAADGLKRLAEWKRKQKIDS